MSKRKSQGKRKRKQVRDFRNYDLAGRELAVIAVNDLHVDPDRFQYKLRAGRDGSVNSLAGIAAWSFAAESVLDVWRDFDGKVYVVNGHNRLARAKQLGVKNLPCKFLNAVFWQQARELGAIANIAAGCGTALDAARFFRDGNWDRARLKRYGIRLSQSVAADGWAIARLCPELFDRALSGTITEKRAAIIGSAGLTPSQQIALASAIDSRESAGKFCTDDTIRELAALAKVSATDTVEQTTLFGFESFERSLIFETAEVQAAIRAQLSGDRRLYRAAVKGADTLESASVATVDRSAGESLADRAKTALERFNAEKLLAGPIAQAVQQAAEQIAAGQPKTCAIAQAYEAVLALLA